MSSPSIYYAFMIRVVTSEDSISKFIKFIGKHMILGSYIRRINLSKYYQKILIGQVHIQAYIYTYIYIYIYIYFGKISENHLINRKIK